MKHIILLCAALLLFASCAKKETAPPAEGKKELAPSGHASGGSLTYITPPSVVSGEQMSPMLVQIRPEGSYNPLEVGSPVSILATTSTDSVQLGTVLQGGTDTAWNSVPKNAPPVKVVLQPAPGPDSTTVRTYSVSLKRNGSPMKMVFGAPGTNSGANPTVGFYFGTYYNGPNFTAGKTAWVMAIDSTLALGQ